MPKLYKITNEMLDVLDDAEKHPAEVNELLENLEVEFKTKAEDCVKAIKNLRSDAEALRDEAARLISRAASSERRAEELQRYVKSQMERLGYNRMGAGIFRLSVVKSPTSVVVTNEAEVPSGFKEVKTEVCVNRKAILEYILETGDIPEGVEILQNTHLRIT